jgi:cell wall assembly regulator SMI1
MIPLISSSAFRTLEPVYIPTDEVQCGNHVIVNIGPPSSSGNAAATATYRTPFATSPFMANSIIRYERMLLSIFS